MDTLLYKKIDDYIKTHLKEARYLHSISVGFTAMNIAVFYKLNKIDALVAGLLHDIAKYYTDDEMIEKCKEYNINLSDDDMKSIGILHSYVGAYEAKKLFDVNDDVFNAIYTHTLGDTNMTDLQKIIFISDFIEPLRDFEEDITDSINYAYIDLDKCMYYSYKQILSYLKKQNKFIHKKTIEVYNYLENKCGK